MSDDVASPLLAARIRRSVIEMTSRGGSSHVASGLSIADILAVLYAEVLALDPRQPDDPKRDRFILSKGHAGAAVYAALAHSGFFEESKLASHYQDGSDLSGHVSHFGNPGVELSTGSLGHGLGVGCGLAYGARLVGHSARMFVLLSDGECDEGTIWEAALFAAHHRLDRLTAVIDYNKLQSLASISDTLELEPFRAKWESFGWECREVDGHDHDQLHEAFSESGADGRPTVVIAHTLKGKGVSFMENNVLWHYRSPQGEELARARAELEDGGVVRDAFIDELSQIVADGSPALLATGDLGFGVLDSFRERFPENYLNVGVAEQNMALVASGVAMVGIPVFTYSIANFPTLRCIEMLRNDVCYHDLPVISVAVGGGFSYGALGMSHHAIEDVGMLRLLHNMEVVVPCDEHEVRSATRALLERGRPGYLRIDKSSVPPELTAAAPDFRLGEMRLLREGSDVTLISMGGIVHEALLAADVLGQQGVHCRVLSCHTPTTLDEAAISAAADETAGIITIEEHHSCGGLGSALAEWLVRERRASAHLGIIGIDNGFSSAVGSQSYLRTEFGLSCEGGLVERIESLMQR